METYIIWAHGNALTVESPENLEPGGIHVGWGADFVLKGVAPMGTVPGSWFHIPIPVPARVDGAPVRLQRVYLFFRTKIRTSFLQDVHIYDGKHLLQEFNNLGRDGDYTIKIVPNNTFVLSRMHTVQQGISLSFFIKSSTGSEPNNVVVSAAGAEYEVSRPFLVAAANAIAHGFDKLIRKGP
jgi:hypothetical protein